MNARTKNNLYWPSSKGNAHPIGPLPDQDIEPSRELTEGWMSDRVDGLRTPDNIGRWIGLQVE